MSLRYARGPGGAQYACRALKERGQYAANISAWPLETHFALLAARYWERLRTLPPDRPAAWAFREALALMDLWDDGRAPTAAPDAWAPWAVQVRHIFRAAGRWPEPWSGADAPPVVDPDAVCAALRAGFLSGLSSAPPGSQRHHYTSAARHPLGPATYGPHPVSRLVNFGHRAALAAVRSGAHWLRTSLKFRGGHARDATVPADTTCLFCPGVQESLHHVTYACPAYAAARQRRQVQDALAAFPTIPALLRGPPDGHPTAQAHHATLGQFYAACRTRRDEYTLLLGAAG